MLCISGVLFAQTIQVECYIPPEDEFVYMHNSEMD